MTYLNTTWWEPNASEPSYHDWSEFTRRRLIWLYGQERADRVRAGKDEATNADIARWNALGQRGGQAA